MSTTDRVAEIQRKLHDASYTSNLMNIYKQDNADVIIIYAAVHAVINGREIRQNNGEWETLIKERIKRELENSLKNLESAFQK